MLSIAKETNIVKKKNRKESDYGYGNNECSGNTGEACV